jgi:hypothetical protein
MNGSQFQKVFVISFLFILPVLLAGCSGVFPSAQAGLDEATATVGVNSPATVESADQVDDMDEPTAAPATIEPTVEPSPTTSLEEAAAPTSEADTAGSSDPAPVRTTLAATNPATVDLASGEIQLIEFFAFW